MGMGGAPSRSMPAGRTGAGLGGADRRADTGARRNASDSVARRNAPVAEFRWRREMTPRQRSTQEYVAARMTSIVPVVEHAAAAPRRTSSPAKRPLDRLVLADMDREPRADGGARAAAKRGPAPSSRLDRHSAKQPGEAAGEQRREGLRRDLAAECRRLAVGQARRAGEIDPEADRDPVAAAFEQDSRRASCRRAADRSAI